jgi:alternate signal-mediated exported protein
MNKLLKGSIAGAAGIALLLGGAGTFALWNDSAVIKGGTVSTGVLSLAAPTTQATWTDVSTASSIVNGTSFDTATQKLVPGDKVSTTQAVTVNASGKNLKANLTFDPTSITTDTTLASQLVYTLVVTAPSGTPAGVVTSNGNNSYTIAPPATGTVALTAVFTVEFKSDTAGTTGQNKATAAQLDALKFTLVQTRA